MRGLKSSGVEKSVWQPEVTILLELKKQLALLQGPAEPKVVTKSAPQKAAPQKAAPQKDASQKAAPKSVDSTPVVANDNSDVIKACEYQITKQAEKVRELKASSDKSVWQPEVVILLALKSKLLELTGQKAPESKTSKKKK